MITTDAAGIGPWVCARTGGSYHGDGAAIGLKKDGVLIAGVLFDMYNGKSACMHVAALPGKRWMTRLYLKACFDYPFRQLRLRKLIGLVDSTNIESLAFTANLGFVTEAVVTDAGKYGDLHILTMTPAQCRFLKD